MVRQKHRCLVVALWLANVSCGDSNESGNIATDAGDDSFAPTDGAGVDTNAESSGGCSLGLVPCGAECVDLRSATKHCGACGNACTVAAPSTAQCVIGRCLAMLAEVPGAPGAIAVDTSHVYWTNTVSGNISKIPIAGGATSNVVVGRSYPTLLAVDATTLYWLDQANSSEAAIMKAALSEGAPSVLVAKSGQVRKFALGGGWLHYAGGYSLSKVSLSGGAPIDMAPGAIGAKVGLSIDETHAYFTSDSEVSRVPLSGGSAVEKIAWDQRKPTAIAVTSTDVFWTNNDPYDNSITKAPKAGGEWKKLVGGVYNFLVSDGTSVYYKTYEDLMKMPASGATRGASIWSSKGSPYAGMIDVAIDGQSFYWLSGGSGVMRVMRLWPR